MSELGESVFAADRWFPGNSDIVDVFLYAMRAVKFFDSRLMIRSSAPATVADCDVPTLNNTVIQKRLL
jgi:hypothetical protein